MDEITVTGSISKQRSNYVISTDTGEDYYLSAILPWEAVSADYGTHEYESHIGHQVTVVGLTDGHTIYGARLVKPASD